MGEYVDFDFMNQDQEYKVSNFLLLLFLLLIFFKGEDEVRSCTSFRLTRTRCVQKVIRIWVCDFQEVWRLMGGKLLAGLENMRVGSPAGHPEWEQLVSGEQIEPWDSLTFTWWVGTQDIFKNMENGSCVIVSAWENGEEEEKKKY